MKPFFCLYEQLLAICQALTSSCAFTANINPALLISASGSKRTNYSHGTCALGANWSVSPPFRPPVQLEWDEWSWRIWLDGSSVLVGMLGQERQERQDGVIMAIGGRERERERVRASISGEPWGGNEMRKVGGRGRVEENDREGVWDKDRMRWRHERRRKTKTGGISKSVCLPPRSKLDVLFRSVSEVCVYVCNYSQRV